MEFWNYLVTSKAQIIKLVIEHIELTAMSVGFAILIGVPLGILISYIKKLNKPVLGIASVIQAIPSMALLGFAIPFLGIGTLPAVSIVILYSLLPIIKNTYTGIESIDPQMIEASKGIGLTKFQILFKVQIPLALPIIMAGVRISAVTAVGLMTLAAMIGAGGLGYLVFSGIRTVNNYQILAGAIPACLLALIVDFLTGQVEKLVTPISLQHVNSTSKKDLKAKRERQKLSLSFAAGLLAIIFSLSALSKIPVDEKVISIGSKDATEQEILSNLFADVIENKTDLRVKRNMALGGTNMCFSALKQKEIDMYVEYSGTAYTETLKHAPISDSGEVYETVKKEFKEKYDIDVLSQMGFNNTYILAVKPEIAEKYNLKTISDLKQLSSDLVLGGSLEFLNREDGLLGLSKVYDMDFKKTLAFEGTPRYIALVNDETDVVDAFATDGVLKKFKLHCLEDDKNFFPPYYTMPIIRGEVSKKYPEIIPAIEEVGKMITEEVMIDLNYQVDELGKEPAAVAKEFLQNNGIL